MKKHVGFDGAAFAHKSWKHNFPYKAGSELIRWITWFQIPGKKLKLWIRFTQEYFTQVCFCFDDSYTLS